MEWGHLKWAWEKSLWIRGPMAALALVALFLPVVGLDRAGFLEFTHALVSGWNHWLDILFGWIEWLIPWEVEWDAFERNLVVFFSVLVLPGFISNAIVASHMPNLFHMPKLYQVILFICLGGTIIIMIWLGFIEGRFSYYDGSWQSITIFFWVTGVSSAGVIALYDYNRTYLAALLGGFLFFAALEVLYFIPVIESALGDFVEWSKTLNR